MSGPTRTWPIIIAVIILLIGVRMSIGQGMGRVALLAARIEFLFDDWLWLIDPAGKRIVEVAAGANSMLLWW